MIHRDWLSPWRHVTEVPWKVSVFVIPHYVVWRPPLNTHALRIYQVSVSLINVPISRGKQSICTCRVSCKVRIVSLFFSSVWTLKQAVVGGPVGALIRKLACCLFVRLAAVAADGVPLGLIVSRRCGILAEGDHVRNLKEGLVLPLMQCHSGVHN